MCNAFHTESVRIVIANGVAFAVQGGGPNISVVNVSNISGDPNTSHPVSMISVHDPIESPIDHSSPQEFDEKGSVEYMWRSKHNLLQLTNTAVGHFSTAYVSRLGVWFGYLHWIVLLGCTCVIFLWIRIALWLALDKDEIDEDETGGDYSFQTTGQTASAEPDDSNDALAQLVRREPRQRAKTLPTQQLSFSYSLVSSDSSDEDSGVKAEKSSAWKQLRRSKSAI